MAAKRDAIATIDSDYLRRLCNALNNQKRCYSEVDRDDLINRTYSKLTSNQVESVLNCYESGNPPWMAADQVNPPSPRDIRIIIEKYYDSTGIYEVKVGERWCDLVFPHHITAIEIKSQKDRLKKAEEQLTHYSQWADYVILAYDQTHKSNLPDSIIDSDVGLFEIEDNSLAVKQDPDKQDIESNTRLRWMTYESLQDYAREYNVEATGTKGVISDRLSSKLSQGKIDEIFINYLKNRS